MECIFDDERGWTVIQNRYAGDVCFNRNWNQYSAGFGCPTGIGALPDWYTNGATVNNQIIPCEYQCDSTGIGNKILKF